MHSRDSERRHSPSGGRDSVPTDTRWLRPGLRIQHVLGDHKRPQGRDKGWGGAGLPGKREQRKTVEGGKEEEEGNGKEK